MYTRIHSPGLHLEGNNTCTHGYILLGYIWRVTTHVHMDTFSWATLEGNNTCTHSPGLQWKRNIIVLF